MTLFTIHYSLCTMRDTRLLCGNVLVHGVSEWQCLAAHADVLDDQQRAQRHTVGQRQEARLL